MSNDLYQHDDHTTGRANVTRYHLRPKTYQVVTAIVRHPPSATHSHSTATSCVGDTVSGIDEAPPHSPPIGSLADLAAIIRSHGYDRKSGWRFAAWAAIPTATLLVGLGLVVVADSAWQVAVGFALVAPGVMGMATATHVASHYAAARRRWINELVTYLGYPLIVGISAEYWHDKHVRRHHRYPNMVGRDPDIDLAPFFLLTGPEVRAVNSELAKRYYRCQWVLSPFAVLLIGFSLQAQSLAYLLKAVSRPRGRVRRVTCDAALLLSHFCAWLLVPSLLLPSADVVTFYLARNLLMGVIAFALFAPGHMPPEATCLLPEQGDLPFAAQQTVTACNYRASPVLRYFLNGIEYQIEHHLFPHIPPYHFARISPMVRQFCNANGLAYNSFSWYQGIRKSFKSFFQPKEIVLPFAGD